MARVNDDALKILEGAKIQGITQRKQDKKEKVVHKALGNCEIEIAKAIATLASRGDESLTPELIKILASICVSATMRYIDLPEDQRVFLDALHSNIEGLYNFTNNLNEEAEGEQLDGELRIP